MQTLVALLLLATAGYCTCRTRFIQFRRFLPALKHAIPHRKSTHGVSPFQAAATSLAATIGTGNIAGVAGAILLGGPGTIFWMWITALLGMSTKYVEIYFGMRLRTKTLIGPMAYIRNGLQPGMHWLAALYAAVCALSCLCMGNLVQVNAVAEAAITFTQSVSMHTNLSPTFLAAAVGTCTAIAVGVVQFGGAKRTGQAAAILVPFMSGLYMLGALIVIVANLSALPGAFSAIIRGAWSMRAFLVGVARGMFTHEAGLGTAAIAHGSADTDEAHGQALYGVFEVFLDTIVICTLTALAILVSGIPIIAVDTAKNSALVIDAFGSVFGQTTAAACICVSLALFAFSSILSFSLYGATCMSSLFGSRAGTLYQIFFLPLLVVGACIRVSAAWQLAEWANMGIGLINSAALVLLMHRGSTHRPSANNTAKGSVFRCITHNCSCILTGHCPGN
ncbi:MAG: amino acid carrier protein [Clostridia bacterium]